MTITLDDINKLIQKQQEDCKPDEDKEYELSKEINDKVAEYALALSGGDTKTINQLEREIRTLKNELGALVDLNDSKKSGAYGRALKTQGELAKLCKQYEAQQYEIAEGMLEEALELEDKFLQMVDDLITTGQAVKAKRQEIKTLLNPLDGIRQYISNPTFPDISTNGNGAFLPIRDKLRQVEFVPLARKIVYGFGIHGTSL